MYSFIFDLFWLFERKSLKQYDILGFYGLKSLIITDEILTNFSFRKEFVSFQPFEHEPDTG